jgi:hypothetical protein
VGAGTHAGDPACIGLDQKLIHTIHVRKAKIWVTTPCLASDYGIKNLKRILPSLNGLV